MNWEQLNKTHSHLTLESVKLLNHKHKYLLKTQQYNMIIVCRKLEMHMEQAQYDQAKWNKVIKHGLTKNEQSL